MFRQGPSPDVLAVNHLDDGFNASPVIVDDALFLRGESLWCIVADPVRDGSESGDR